MQSLGRLIVVSAAAAVSGIGFSPALADVKAGVDAWQAGNFDAAVKEWRPFADKGDADAQFNMGQAYKLGRGVPSDLRLAQSWYQKAAQQGHEQAQANLGLILFQNGEREAAIPWIRKAADHGDPRAQYVLGTTLFNGDIVAKDWPRAYALMIRAAAQGLPQATTSLTEMDGFIPLADRQKGVALARDLERAEASSAAASGTAAKPATARPAPAQPIRTTSLPPSQPAKVTPAAKPAPAAAKPANVGKPATMASAGGKWRVQLGAYGSIAGAKGQWASLSKRIGALSGLQASYEPAGALTRLRAGPLADRGTADRVCAAAKAAGQACFAIAP
ncbi:MAG TPA: SPOR domain-containing protein [Allosphingosinicella sp.]|nr:SPOR domain-containing protein [Allosphingosinicella sp.]